MKTSFLYGRYCLTSQGLLLCAALLSTTYVQAQSALPLPPPPEIRWPEPEPERWTQEDVTLEQRFDTARKETLAAHQEAMNACKGMHPSEQTECASQAKAQLELELAQLKAKARFGMEPN
ncbi:MAG: hypothetical protein WCG12_06800 [Alcaligenaceae bacterium]